MIRIRYLSFEIQFSTGRLLVDALEQIMPHLVIHQR